MSIRVRPWRKDHHLHPGSNNEHEVHIRVRLTTGAIHEERKKFCGTKTEAKFWAEERVHLLVVSCAKKPSVRLTLASFAPDFMTASRNRNKPSSLHSKEWILRVHLVPAFGSTFLDDISPTQIEDFKADKLASGQQPKSVNNLLTVLRALLNYAEQNQRLARVPRIVPLKVPDDQRLMFLDFAETERFMSAAPLEWKTFLLVALKTGLRLGELLALKWEDIDLVKKRLIVRRTLWQHQEVAPKSGKTREVPLSDDALTALKNHRHLRGPYVFCAENGDRLTHRILSRVVPHVCVRAGLTKRLTMHSLRHTFASHLVMRNVPLKAVQELLGHSTITMTLRYAHLGEGAKRDAVMLLDGPPPRIGERMEKEPKKQKAPGFPGA